MSPLPLKALALCALLAASAGAQEQFPDVGKALGKFKSGAGGGDSVPGAPGAPIQLADKLPATTADNGEAMFFSPARQVLLYKGGDPNVRCTILDFIASHPDRYSKLDDAGYETKVKETIDNTEFYILDVSCREKLKVERSDAVAIVAANKKSVGKTCGYKFPDTSKDLMVIWGNVDGDRASLPRKRTSAALSAHEVMHLLLSNLSKVAEEKGGKDRGKVQHGLLNFLKWGKGDPTQEWKPADPEKCKKKDDSQKSGGALSAGDFSVGNLSSSGPAEAGGETSDETVGDVPDLE